ncbi:MAG: LysM peptidoglycan-binding domain-containing protein [Myxococcaceae bacterium]
MPILGRLTVPTPSEPPASRERPTVYTVQPGDTLDRIAGRLKAWYGSPASVEMVKEAICRVNDIPARSWPHIGKGEMIFVPSLPEA